MRRSEFQQLVEDEFGVAYASTLLATHVLGELGDRTAHQALGEGVEPKRVWFALCADLDVPRERWWGRQPPPGKRAGRPGRG